MENLHRFAHRWTLADLSAEKTGEPKHGASVFSCFSGGGGSSMGYKLAGYDVRGCVEIDPQMAACYERNLHPKYVFKEDIREVVKKAAAHQLPEELYSLDVLDGSPPCSTFSMSGDREKAWGVEKAFREGQKKQVLDTLYFDFIALAGHLRPRFVVSENVTGILLGEAVKYGARILKAFDAAGYVANHWTLEAERMGVPQSRHRVFFLAVRKDLVGRVPTEGMVLRHPKINLNFDEPVIPFREIDSPDATAERNRRLMPKLDEKYDHVPPGHHFNYIFKNSYFNFYKTHPDLPLVTILGNSKDKYVHHAERRTVNNLEYTLAGTFPTDYDFGEVNPIYVIGMSVPPVMMAQIAARIKGEWIDRCR